MSLWGGLGQAFGPSQTMLPDSAGAVEGRVRQQRSFDPTVEARWRRLHERRGAFCPYARLGLQREDVSDHLAKAVHLLEDLGITRPRESKAVPGPHGHPYAADLASEAVRHGPFTPGTRVLVVTAASLDAYRADRVAQRLNETDALEVETWSGPPFNALDEGAVHPVGAARHLQESLSAEGASLFDPLVSRCREASIDAVLLPPCLGSTLERNRAIMEVLRQTLPCDVAEMPADRDSVHGWRLDRALRDSPAPEVTDAAVASITAGTEGVDITLESGESRRVSACILATGGFFDGGLPGSAPFREPLTDAPLWVGGSPVSDADTFFAPRLLEDQPWGDHRLFRAGVTVDEKGRILDRDGAALGSGLYAAGRLLSGFNPLHDGCAMGVELVSGLAVADSALEDVEAGT
jgi:anaerobic glycerol-3-phosphate dehydrogenase